MPRQGIMLATPYDLKRFLKWRSKGFIQPKLNGERCRAYLDENGRCRLLSSESNEIISVPHINKAFEATGLKNIELDGELYTHGMDFDEIRSRVGRSVNLHPNYNEINYNVFDIINTMPQLKRIELLYNTLSTDSDIIKRVNGWSVESEDDIMYAYEKFMLKGYEGFILRSLDATYERRRVTTMMKHKPRESDTFKIIGFKEEIDKNNKPKNRMGALELQGDLGSFTASGMTDEEKEFFWKIKEKLIGRKALIEYQYLTSKRGVPRHPIFIKVEV
jgi:ATP-dependent DNA ligase